MCEIKASLIVAASLLAATGFCIYQVSSEKKVEHYSEIKVEVLAKKSTRSIVSMVTNAII